MEGNSISSEILKIAKELIADDTAVKNLVDELLRIQIQRKKNLNDAAANEQNFGKQIVIIEDRLIYLLKARKIDPIDVANELVARKIDIGEMSSPFVDLIEAKSGKRIYPPQYRPDRSPWAIVSR